MIPNYVRPSNHHHVYTLLESVVVTWKYVVRCHGNVSLEIMIERKLCVQLREREKEIERERRKERRGKKKVKTYPRRTSRMRMRAYSYHLTVGFGSPTNRHSKVMVLPSSDCLITGRSVKVGLIPSSGTGASSPMFTQTIYVSISLYTISFICRLTPSRQEGLSPSIQGQSYVSIPSFTPRSLLFFFFFFTSFTFADKLRLRFRLSNRHLLI